MIFVEISKFLPFTLAFFLANCSEMTYPVSRNKVDRLPVQVIDCVALGACLDEGRDGVEITRCTSRVEGGQAVIVSCPMPRTCLEQALHHSTVPLLGRQVQRCAPLLILDLGRSRLCTHHKEPVSSKTHVVPLIIDMG